MAKPRIAIVGAGLGGLTAALAFAKRGFPVTVYERTKVLGEVGAGITLWPNANKPLFSLGLKDELARISEVPTEQAMWHFATAEIFKRYPRGEAMWQAYGAPLYQIHRRDLHDMLIAAFQAEQPDAIKLGKEVVAVETNENDATITFKDGEKVTADLVIGADGIRSAVRNALFGTEPAKFTGIVAWRALVPIERVPQRLRDTPAGMHIGPDRNVSHYTVRHGALYNYLGFAKVNTWEEEGWTIRAQVSQVLDVFKDFQPDIVNLIKATPEEGLYKWGLFDRDPTPQWTKGRTTLMGDAAHPMLPFLGQGAGMVIEDALVLARAVAESTDIPTALKRYEAARKERANYTMLRSRAHADFWNTHPDQIRNIEPKMEVDLNVYDAVTVPI